MTVGSGGPELGEVARPAVFFREAAVYENRDRQAPKPKKRTKDQDNEAWKTPQSY